MIALFLMLMLAPPSVREVKYMVLFPQELKATWVTEDEFNQKKKEATERQIKELSEDPTIQHIYAYDRNVIYIHRRSNDKVEQYWINGKPFEKVPIKFSYNDLIDSSQ